MPRIECIGFGPRKKIGYDWHMNGVGGSKAAPIANRTRLLVLGRESKAPEIMDDESEVGSGIVRLALVTIAKCKRRAEGKIFFSSSVPARIGLDIGYDPMFTSRFATEQSRMRRIQSAR